MIFVFELALKKHMPLYGLNKFYESHSANQAQGYGPIGCVVWSHRSKAEQIVSVCHCLLCARRSMHECAPVKIDLLKGQQPLNLLPQEACSALQGDSTLRNM